MKNWKGKSFASVYQKLLTELYNNPEFITSPRQQKIKEILNCSITITDPYSNLFKNKIRNLPLKYLVDELILYFSGENKAQYYKQASAFWENIKNDDGTVNSAYGNLIFIKRDAKNNMTQWEWAKNCLKNDKDSRQAVLHYNRPEHQFNENKDFVCTMLNQFFIRNNKLYLTTYIRSNDAIFGISFDLPFFMLLMQCMLLELKTDYPDLELGEYNHFIGSCHIYEKHFDLVEQMIKHKFAEYKLPKLQKSIILDEELFKMKKNINYNYLGDDKFLIWLNENR